MIVFSRYITALSLALVLCLASALGSFAMGPQRGADGGLIICNGSGLVTISLGAGDTAPTVTLMCPDCLAGDAAEAPAANCLLAGAIDFDAAVLTIHALPNPGTDRDQNFNPRAPPMV